MRKSLLALLAALCLWPWAALAENTVGPTNQVICNNQAFISNTNSATTAAFTTPVNYASTPGGGLVGIASKTIFICGWHATGAGAFQIVTGTGATCSSPVALTPVFAVTTTAPSSDHISIASISVPTGNNVCLTTSGTVTSFSFGLWYGQY
jgi:hypothetical protein